ncbi:alkaline phosphatase family protein [Tomitella biformata]
MKGPSRTGTSRRQPYGRCPRPPARAEIPRRSPATCPVAVSSPSAQARSAGAPRRLRRAAWTLRHTAQGPRTSTSPNRNYWISGYTWTTVPERLEAAGVSWRTYQEWDNFTDNNLEYFLSFQQLVHRLLQHPPPSRPCTWRCPRCRRSRAWAYPPIRRSAEIRRSPDARRAARS